MNKINFAPMLYIKSGVINIDFYVKAFGAVEVKRWTNDDGTLHVSEISIEGVIFHLHEDNLKPGLFSPDKHNGTTAVVGLFVSDVDVYMKNAIIAGATLISEAQDYDYGYRQGEIKDPFGHHWVFEKKI